jgi:Protein of unknown function (DUF3987)
VSPPDGAAEIRRMIAMANEVAPEPPRPLMRELPPADPFPIDAVGETLGGAARTIHDRVQAPVAICAQSVLGAAALATQGHADVVLPIGPGQPRPLSCYLITVAATGERKTACDTEAMWPIRHHEARLREAHDDEAVLYANNRAAYDRARDVALRAGKGDRVAICTALDGIGAEPISPLTPMLTCPEPTYEGNRRQPIPLNKSFLIADQIDGSTRNSSSTPSPTLFFWP